MPPVRYKAFISYSHATDGRLAPALQSAIQQFAKPWYRLRSVRLFRDTTSLSATPELWPSIVKALETSEWFLLMASPEAAGSVWVDREIEWWLQNRSAERILILLTEGELFWDPETSCFDMERSSAISPVLRQVFSAEPLFVDVRWARTQEKLSLRHSRFRAAVLDIAAPLQGRPKDELDGEDVRQHRKVRRLVVTVTTALALITLAAGIAAYLAVRNSEIAETRRQEAEDARTAEEAQRRVAETRREEADEARRAEEAQRKVAEDRLLIARAETLAAQSMALPDSRLDLALLLSVEAHRTANLVETREALLSSLQSSPRLLAHLHHGNQVLTNFRFGNEVRSVAFAPDGRTLASGSSDGTVRLWSVKTRKPIGEHLSHSDFPVLSLDFSPDGRTLASGGAFGNLCLWNIETRQRLFQDKGSGQLWSLAFAPDGETLAMGRADGIRLWNLDTLQPLEPPLRSRLPTLSVAFGPDGKTLVSTGGHGTVYLWNLETGQPLGESMFTSGSQMSVAFGPEGLLLASGSNKGTVSLWFAGSQESLGEPLSHPGMVRSVAIAHGDSIVASGGSDGIVRLWDVHTRPPLGEPLFHGGEVFSVAFAPDGKILASGGSDGIVRLWSVDSRQPLSEPDSAWGRAAIFAPDAKTLALARSDGIYLWDVHTRQPLGDPLSRYGSQANLTFTPDGRTLASTGSEGIHLWDVHTRQPLGEPLSRDEEVFSLAFAPDGKILASAGSEGIHLWDVHTRQHLVDPLSSRPRGANAPDDLAFAPDGKTLAWAGDGTGGYVDLWDLDTQQGLDSFRSRGVQRIAFSPNGRTLAAGSPKEGTVRLFDTATWQPLGEPLSQEGLTYLAFTPDGRTLASAGSEGIHLWDVHTRQPLGEPLSQEGVTYLSFGPDGKTLVSSGSGGVRFWDLDPLSWRRRACRLANRNLSLHEWERYMGSPEVPYRCSCPDRLPGFGTNLEQCAGAETAPLVGMSDSIH